MGIGLSGAPKAVYSLATRKNGRWHAEHRYVDYDLEHTLKRFEETAYLEYTGVIGKLYRLELMTGKTSLWRSLNATATGLTAAKSPGTGPGTTFSVIAKLSSFFY